MGRGTWKARRAADHDVDGIADFIAARNPDAAERFVIRVKESFELLAEFPQAGRARRARSPELEGLRCWPLGGRFSNYLILYLERDFGVEILRVLHAARDVDRVVDELE